MIRNLIYNLNYIDNNILFTNKIGLNTIVTKKKITVNKCLKIHNFTLNYSKLSYLNRTMKSKDRNILAPPLYPKNQWIPIGTGNYYKGEWNHRTMSGKGVYVMLDGNHKSIS